MSYEIHLVKSASKDYKRINGPFKTQIRKSIDNLEIFGLNAPDITL